MAEAVATPDRKEPSINDLLVDGERDKDYFSVRTANAGSAKRDFVDG